MTEHAIQQAAADARDVADRKSAPMARRTEVRHSVVRLLARWLAIEEGSMRGAMSFREIGMDSLSKVGVVATLEERFGCQIGKEALFDYPTVDDLVAHICDLLAANEPTDKSN